MIVVMLMVCLVDVLLLVATGILFEEKGRPLRILAGSLFGTAFTGLSMVPGFDFLGHFLWRMCSLIISALLTFGISERTLPKLLLFSLLHLSLGGIAEIKNDVIAMLMGAAGICFACLVVERQRGIIPVELTYGEKTIHITALSDTGNTLLDPITGRQVLVVGADVAQALTGLTSAALRDPVGSIGTIPGLRLIPYQTVGNTGFLLAMNIQNAKIGNRQESTLVAFSPLVFNSHYQALTGGTA